MEIHNNDYEKLICIENLLRSWLKFKIGKDKKFDVMMFERHLEDNLFQLYQELKDKTYRHSEYEYFKISDPKKRDIYKSKVADRIVHQALYEYLSEIYEPVFIEHSYSSRIGKGTHKAVSQLKRFTEEISKNNRRCFTLKFDIRKFFENINHETLLKVLEKRIENVGILGLLKIIVKGFNGGLGKGIPLGNITSQIFANIYLNELDYFIKNELRLKHYLRYNDDFIILGYNREVIFKNAAKIREFVRDKLLLEIPDKKMIFRKLRWGIDFCGYIVLPDAVLLRKKTKKRMMKNIAIMADKRERSETSLKDFAKTIDSYFGLLNHCDSHNLKNKIRNKFLYGKII